MLGGVLLLPHAPSNILEAPFVVLKLSLPEAKLRPRVSLPRPMSSKGLREPEVRGRQLQRLVGRHAPLEEFSEVVARLALQEGCVCGADTAPIPAFVVSVQVEELNRFRRVPWLGHAVHDGGALLLRE